MEYTEERLGAIYDALVESNGGNARLVALNLALHVQMSTEIWVRNEYAESMILLGKYKDFYDDALALAARGVTSSPSLPSASA